MTVVGGTGIEWVCVRPVHAKIYQRRSSDRTHKKGDPIYPQAPRPGEAPQADRHYFRRKYPNREEKADS